MSSSRSRSPLERRSMRQQRWPAGHDPQADTLRLGRGGVDQEAIAGGCDVVIAKDAAETRLEDGPGCARLERRARPDLDREQAMIWREIEELPAVAAPFRVRAPTTRYLPSVFMAEGAHDDLVPPGLVRLVREESAVRREPRMPLVRRRGDEGHGLPVTREQEREDVEVPRRRVVDLQRH